MVYFYYAVVFDGATVIPVCQVNDKCAVIYLCVVY